MADEITDEMLGELVALQMTEDELGRPSSLHKCQWHGPTGALARRRLVTWKRGGAAWGPDFREVGLTSRGTFVLALFPKERQVAALNLAMAEHP